MRQALVVVNRVSREGEASLGAGLDLLRGRGMHLVEFFMADPSAIPETIRLHRQQVDLIIVGGGDGTFNRAAAALVEADLPLGIVPMGTANDLARSLGIPFTPMEACRVIAEGRVQRIDLGEVNGHFFFNAASIGLGVRVTHRLTRESKAKWGVLAYAVALLAVMRENRSFTVDIDCDGSRLRHRSIQVAVGNGRHYGGGMTIAADATLDDHCLHLYSLEPQSLWQLIRLAPALRRGDYQARPGIRLMSGQSIEIRTRQSLSIDTDGELTTRTPAAFRIIRKALPVYVPAARGDEEEIPDVSAS